MADMRGLEPRAARHKGSSPLLPTILCEVSSVGRASALQAEGRRFEPVTSHHFNGHQFSRLERHPDKMEVPSSTLGCPTSDTISETHLGYTTQQIVSIRLAAILSESSVVPENKGSYSILNYKWLKLRVIQWFWVLYKRCEPCCLRHIQQIFFKKNVGSNPTNSNEFWRNGLRS